MSESSRASLFPLDVLIVGTLVGGAFFISMSAGLICAGGVMIAFLLAGKVDRLLVMSFAAMPYQEAVGGDNVTVNASLVDCIAAILLVVVIVRPLRGLHLFGGPTAGALLVFLGFETLSSLLQVLAADSVVSLARMAMQTLVAVLLFANLKLSLKSMYECFYAYLLAIVVLFCFVLATFLTKGYEASSYTLELNKNFMGIVFGCGIVTAVTFLSLGNLRRHERIWVMFCLGAGSVGIVLSLSRGAWIATTVALSLVLLLARKGRAFIGLVCAAVPAIFIIWHMLPEKATDYATNFSTESYQIKSRLESIGIAMEAFRAHPFMGAGVGLRKTVEPHNVLILTLGEGGLCGLVAFGIVFGSGFYALINAAASVRKWPEGRTIIVAGSGIFVAALVHGAFDVYWRRGVGFMSWATLGMAVQLLRTEKALRKRRQLSLTEEDSSLGATVGEEKPSQTLVI